MPFDNQEADPLMAEADRKVHEDVPKWGNILPRIDAGLNPILRDHEEDLRTAYGYEKKPDGSWAIKPGFDPPGKKVWGEQPRGQVEVPPYSIQQGRAPGPRGMEQHQGGRVFGVADQMETNRQRAERERAQEQADALDNAMKTQPPRYSGDRQVEGYATIVTPVQGLKRVHVKSPQYKWAKKGKNGYSMPSDDVVPHGSRSLFPPGTDLRELPDSEQPPTAIEGPMAGPLGAPGPPGPSGTERWDTDSPGTEFVSAPAQPGQGERRAHNTEPSEYPGQATPGEFGPNIEVAPAVPLGQPPPNGVYPEPTGEMRAKSSRMHNVSPDFDDKTTNPRTGDPWGDDEERRKFFWDNREIYGLGGREPQGQGQAGERMGINQGSPQGQPTRPENWQFFPNAPRPPGAPPIMSDPGRPVQGQSRTPAPGMMYGNRQLQPEGAADPNVPVPGYIPGVDSRENPPFDPNQPFGYQQPGASYDPSLPQGEGGMPNWMRRSMGIPIQRGGRQRRGDRESELSQDFTEENLRLEGQIPESTLTPEGNLPVDQQIRVGEPDPFGQPEETGDPYSVFDPELRETAQLRQSKIDAVERASHIEHLIIQGEEQYLIDNGVLSRGEIARIKVELIREGKIEGESPAQRVIGGLAGATSPQSGEGSPLPTDPTEQLGILQRIKAKRIANQTARQQRGQ